jgi:hypothetical protein
MDYTLSNGDVVQLRDRSTLTQRMNLPVLAADTRATPVRKKLIDAGYRAEDPSTFGIEYELPLEDFQRLNDVKTALIAAMVVAWPWDLPITIEGADSVHPDVFEELASACMAAYQGTPIEIDPDPNLPGADSTD